MTLKNLMTTHDDIWWPQLVTFIAKVKSCLSCWAEQTPLWLLCRSRAQQQTSWLPTCKVRMVWTDNRLLVLLASVKTRFWWWHNVAYHITRCPTYSILRLAQDQYPLKSTNKQWWCWVLFDGPMIIPENETPATIHTFNIIGAICSRWSLLILLDSGSPCCFIKQSCLSPEEILKDLSETKSVKTLSGQLMTQYVVTLHNICLPKFESPDK